MSLPLHLSNNECIELQLAFSDIEDAIKAGEYQKAMSLCNVWYEECRYSKIIDAYELTSDE